MAHGANLVDAGVIGDVLAHEALQVLVTPAFRIRWAIGEERFGEPSPLKQAFECLVRGSSRGLAPFADRNRMEPQREVAAGERSAGLTKRVNSGAVCHQKRLARGPSVERTLEVGLPFAHLVHFVEDHQSRARAPALREQHAPVRRDVPVEILGVRVVRHERPGERCLSDLPRSGKEHHLLAEIALHRYFKIASHTTIFQYF